MRLRTRYIALEWVGRWIIWQDCPRGKLAVGDTEAEVIGKLKQAFWFVGDDGQNQFHEEDWERTEKRLLIVPIPWPADDSEVSTDGVRGVYCIEDQP